MVKRRRRRKQTFVLNKTNIGIGLIVLGGLYFFSLYLAQGSPISMFLTEYTSIAFGAIGLNIFFVVCIISGIIILSRGYMLRTLVKQLILFMFLVSAILNFPIIDEGLLQTNLDTYSKLGGYISWPLLRILDNIFGSQAIAIKVFVILIFIALIIWILYAFNISLPRLRIKEYRDNRSSVRSKKYANSGQKAVKSSLKSRSSYQDSRNTEVSKSFIKDIMRKKVKEKQLEEKTKKYVPIKFAGDKPTFSASILTSGSDITTDINENFLVKKAQELKDKLLEFNLPVSIEGFDMGPSIVQIRIKPEEGIRLSAIENLTNDIKLSLKTKSLRIVAPIPGTDTVGIQIPNPKPVIIRVGDMLSSREFQVSMNKSNTNLTLGKQIDGSIITRDLESMPHLLVAGATGSGKSVGINDFILSLMYQNSPSELKFLMIDPKQVELELYSGLPYMLGPIVSDSVKALKLLRRATEEMEKRYGLLKSKRVRNIGEYNKKVFGTSKLYRIVIVIDELADMMMHKNKKDVETVITRIAQKARAVGIHLIVATQRPSVNVITGLIKANIPTRIAFGVVSEIDSRTILGRKGAEDLLGKGDLLYIDPKTKRPIRIQAPFVGTDEIERVVSRLKNKYMKGLSEEDVYHPEIIQALASKLETAGGYGSYRGGSDEELIKQAIQVIAQTRKASATLLQRKLNVGFARAARIMDELEERGIVGPQDGARAREVFI